MATRLERVQQVLDEALDLPESERDAFIERACDDPETRTEVLSLLSAYTRAERVIPDTVRMHAQTELRVGEKVGAYTVLERIGSGGMGVVYRARDEQLGRDVALKTIAPDLAGGSHGWTRLEREARALAALNHPAIAQIHALERSDSGAIVLVLEHVPGPTLAQRLAQGALPVSTSIEVACNICHALDAAHSAGIMHRDLKPANIKLIGDTGVKLLDFGLAKERTLPHDTRATNATLEGIVLGTASYMSPEQARGQQVDQRTDIWALGCVLYEMLTGRQAFAGGTPSDIIASVLTDEPDWTPLPRRTPSHVQGVLRRCLEKSASDRWHSAADVRLELLRPHTISRAEPVSRRRALRTGVMFAGLLAAGGSVGYVLGRRGYTQARASRPVRFRIDLSPQAMVPGPPGAFCISPDGRTLLLTCEESRNKPSTLWMHRLDHGASELVPDSQYSWAPCFSPDGTQIARGCVGTSIEVRRIMDGSTRVLEVGESEPRGMTWHGMHALVYSTQDTMELRLVDIRSGAISRLTTLDPTGSEYAHVQPCALPDGRTVLYSCLSEEPATRRIRHAIHAVNVKTGARTPVLDNAYRPKFVGQGTLLFARGLSIRRVRFDPRSLKVTGESTELASLATSEEGMPFARFDASSSGVLAFDPCPRNYESSEVIYQQFGGGTRTLVHPGPECVGIDVSRDERLLVVVHGWTKTAVSIYNIDAGNSRWLGVRDAGAGYPLISPDSRHLVFHEQVAPTTSRIVIAPTDTSTPPRTLIEREQCSALLPCSFSPDGAWLYVTMTPAGGQPDLYRLSLADPRELHRLLPDEGKVKRLSPALSPDGTLLAFSSTIGGDTGLYLARGPDYTERMRVSRRIGMRPQWSADGRFLYYIDFQDLHRVEVQSEPILRVSEPELLLRGNASAQTRVAPSGRGVYVCSPPGGRDARHTHLEVITGLQWS